MGPAVEQIDIACGSDSDYHDAHGIEYQHPAQGKPYQQKAMNPAPFQEKGPDRGECPQRHQ